MGIDGGGRRIETPAAFAADEGNASLELAKVLAQFHEMTATYADVIAVLKTSRLLVPVVAVLDEQDESGADKSSHMATVTLVQSDGRRGLLAFTSVEHLQRWDPQARPVPAAATDVCAAALDEGAQGVLLDVAGPVRFAIDNDALQELASQSKTAVTDDVQGR